MVHFRMLGCGSLHGWRPQQYMAASTVCAYMHGGLNSMSTWYNVTQHQGQ